MIKFSKTQLEHNKAISGGLIAALLLLLARPTAASFLASKLAPPVITGLLTGV